VQQKLEWKSLKTVPSEQCSS